LAIFRRAYNKARPACSSTPLRSEQDNDQAIKQSCSLRRAEIAAS